MQYEAIIIGRGPAGMSAALYTIRANVKTLVVGTCESTVIKADKIENYYGFSQPVSGKALFEEGQKQIKAIGGEVLTAEVVGIEKEDQFIVKTTKGTYQAQTVLIATGQKTAKIKIRNIQKFEGKGISYCSTCDGFFYRNKKVGVLGFKDYALHEAQELLPFTSDITLFTNGEKTEFSKEFDSVKDQFQINTKPIQAFEGEAFLEKLVFDDGTEFPVEGVFIAYDSASGLSFALKMGILTQNQAIQVNARQETNIEGLYAAGDCTGVFKQISVAVGQGAIAGRQMTEYVRKKKK